MIINAIGKIVSLDTTVNTTKMEDEKMNNVRIVKFEKLVEDIDSAIKSSKHSVGSGMFSAFLVATGATTGGNFSSGSAKNTALALIFEYNKCNEYARAIMDKSTLWINTSSNYEDVWRKRYPSYGSFGDVKGKIIAARDFVKYCRQSNNVSEGYKFIFWALMILTVDKSNAEEYLSLICDFAQMLNISDVEFEDIIKTVKVIYNEVERDYVFKSEMIPSIFGSLINLFYMVNRT